MSPSARLALIVAASCAAGAAALAVGSVRLLRWARARRSKSPEELERLRRLEVNRSGRIAAGEVVDLVEDGRTGQAESPRRVVVYRYEVAGVTYEAAQDVSSLSVAGFLGEALTGLTSSVKYDPDKPMNSIIACEGWNGMARERMR